MQGHCRRMKSVVAACLIASLLSVPTAAQQPGKMYNLKLLPIAELFRSLFDHTHNCATLRACHYKVVPNLTRRARNGRLSRRASRRDRR